VEKLALQHELPPFLVINTITCGSSLRQRYQQSQTMQIAAMSFSGESLVYHKVYDVRPVSDLLSSSQPQSSTGLSSVPADSTWEQRNVCMNNLPSCYVTWNGQQSNP